MREAKFHNPYTFIWTPPRDKVPKGSFAGDRDPTTEADHSRLHPDLYTGTIRVKLTAVTPLLLVRTPPAFEDPDTGHKAFDSRDDIPATAFKGMLRTAYEAVTNSRYGVFIGHDKPLGRRAAATSALDLVPGRVERRDDKLSVRLLRGKAELAPAGAFRFDRNGRQRRVYEGTAVRSVDARTHEVKTSRQGFAALLPQYDRDADTVDRGGQRSVNYYSGTSELPAHGDPCWIEITEDNNRFAWKVTRIWKRESDIAPRDAREPHPGWVYRTGPTIDLKHQERVFFERSGRAEKILPLSEEVIDRYQTLIRDYQRIHEKDAQERRRRGQRMSDYLDREPGKTAFGPYVYEAEYCDLQPGHLVFVRLRDGRPVGLYPCMISRDLQLASPEDLLDPSLRPASALDSLSPADRLFGWVRQGKKRDGVTSETAWRGRLRITTSRTLQSLLFEALSSDAEPHGLPLAILGEPKPAQARFYVGERDGSPLTEGLAKDEAVYRTGRSLRGRKAYWHHKGAPEEDGYWSNPLDDRTGPLGAEPGYHQEYRRPRKPTGEEQRDSQNRSLRRWISPGSTATFTVHLTNARLEEVGALLYLAQLEPGSFFRLGGGKPLGFGSVRLDLEPREGQSVRLARGGSWAAYFGSLEAEEPKWEEEVEPRAVDTFYASLADAYSVPSGISARERFAQLPFVRHFEASCQGPQDGLAVHYPRVTATAEPEGKNFEWFGENEREQDRKRPGLPLPLPAGAALPYWPWRADPRAGQQGGGNPRQSSGDRPSPFHRRPNR